jgi:hypothetical protein
VLAAILATTAIAFSRAFASRYVSWDDDRLVLHNLYLTLPFVEAMKGVWSHSYDGSYLPVPFVSYWLEIQAFGFDPMPQHVVNVVLHLLNVCLLYVWLSKLRVTRGVAMVLTMIFALHPVQVESVMWIGERKGLLGASFLLMGLLALARARAVRPASLPWTIVWTVCFTLSLLCKTIGVLLPFLFPMYSRWMKRESWQESVRPHLAAALIAVAFSILQYKAYTVAVPGGGSTALAPEHWPVLGLMIPTAIGHYLASLLYPLNLSIIYAPFEETPNRLFKLVLGTAYLGLVARAVLKCRREPEVLLGLCSLALLAPTIPRFNYVNDRYLYLPIVGMCGVLIHLASAVRLPAGRLTWRIAGPCAGILLAAMSFAQSRIWQDSLALWSGTVRRVPQSQLALTNLGVAQHERGNAELAAQTWLKATTVKRQQNALPYINLAQIYLARREPAKVRRIVTQGLPFADAPEDQFALRFAVGRAQLQLGESAAARATFSGLLNDMKGASSNAYNLRLEQRVRQALSATNR